MIVVVGSTGIAAWEVRSRIGQSRILVCLNDGFSQEFPITQTKNPRGLLQTIRTHSELLFGRTLSIAELSELT